MPLPIILLAGGFGAGLFVGAGTTKLVKYGVIGGGVFLAYQLYKGA